ncbi:metallophosphoesterase family protein [Rhizobium oryzicola]|uniref:Metallophosphoesterase n=1 Tax=Rhizobium oryzicola TaxID=1232668 RepID=A0ABT8SZ05_9HYPH|nr:metallophosphoesterase [Rhizobium oryzicola]MDO1583118.1 metallophosphoesterase [Rhizobium oryzicola]
MQLAVVADVHLHDLYGGYGLIDEGSGGMALRTLADTMASTRVFNESHPAFLAVLEDIVGRGIRTVVLLGDYSDDGQPGAVAALKRILSLYEERHGLRFFATFGNHDCFGPEPRHQGKWLTVGAESEPVLVTSDPDAPLPAVVKPAMRGMSTAEAMQAMGGYGIARPGHVGHWETPFGDREALQERYPEGGDPEALDASYLVEPHDGLWLLVLDANVFTCKNGFSKLESDAAWDHVLARRPYLLEWIEAVAQRAKRLGKTLLAFSHYPALPLSLMGEGERSIAVGTSDWLKRMPSLETGRSLAGAGLTWHFSGHMHVAGRTQLYGLTNVAVPSPVGYPGGYVVIDIDGPAVEVQMVELTEVAGFDVAFAAYNAQRQHDPNGLSALVIGAAGYADFLEAHLRALVTLRHVPNDWPELVAYLDQPIGTFCRQNAGWGQVLAAWEDCPLVPLRVVLEDYYLRRARGLNSAALDHLTMLRTSLRACS